MTTPTSQAQRIAEAWQAIQSELTKRVYDDHEFFRRCRACYCEAQEGRHIKHTDSCPVGIIAAALLAPAQQTDSDIIKASRQHLNRVLNALSLEVPEEIINDVRQQIMTAFDSAVAVKAAPVADSVPEWARFEYEVIKVRKDFIPKGGELVEAYETEREIIVIGMPEPEPEGLTDKQMEDWYETAHNCDAMGCGTLSHVIYRFDKPATGR